MTTNYEETWYNRNGCDAENVRNDPEDGVHPENGRKSNKDHDHYKPFEEIKEKSK